jgi:menaquinone-dependent protoporphyrinogen oxidase
MKTAIVYKTRHGTTEKVAKLIAARLKEDHVDLINLHDNGSPELDVYDRIIVGGSIHAGNIQRGIRIFCEEYKDALLNKELGLFMCCMDPDEGIRQLEFEGAYPAELRERSAANGIMGGEFLFEKMNFLEKLAVRKIAKREKTVSEIDGNAIKRFARELMKNHSARHAEQE